MGDTRLELGNRKLVVLGIPWDIDTDGLRQYMSKYGTLDDVVVMKERRSGRSRGFGYVTFSTAESSEKALASKHILNGRLLEVKVATPKEDMKAPPKKITRIFVARIPSKVSEEAFRRYFEEFGTITDLYMPKERGAKSHRGIGFITYEDSESVAKVMAETHEIGGSTVAVDEAAPKEEGGKPSGKNDYSGSYLDKEYTSAYGAYSPYIAAGGGGPRFPPYGLSPFGAYDYAGSGYASDFRPGALGGGFGGSLPSGGLPGSGSGNSRSGAQAPSGGIRNKIFVGKLPSEATTEELRRYFGNFGRILDVYLPKDSKRKGQGHRGFAFVTFADEGPAERVSRRSHELLGHQIVVEQAQPPDEAGFGDGYPGVGAGMALSGLGGAGPAYPGSSYTGLDYYNAWGGGYGGGVGPMGGDRASRMDLRYRPY